MEEQSSPALPKELNQKYEDAIRRNLDALMRSAGISQTQLVAELEGRGLSVGQGNLSQYLSGKKHIPLSLIVHLCDYFNMSLAELVDENFGGAKQAGAQMPQLYSDDLLLQVPYLGDAFVIDPSDPHFFGYLQTYYVYLFPSQAEEERIRTGTLKLMANGSVCEAVLEIDTNKLTDGKPIIKVYRGRCIISTTMRAVYILLTAEKGELSVLNFRYFNLMQLPLDCRIACTLINSTGEEHPPTVQRMFLSRTKIDEEHLPLLLPHLYLNSGTIRIRKEHLDALREESELFRDPVDAITAMVQPTPIYCLDEDHVLISAKQYLTKPQVQIFLSRIRSLSEHHYLNKASRQADLHSHRLLRSLGYFHDHDN